MSKKMSPEVNAALIQAAATIACRQHQVMVDEFLEKEMKYKNITRADAMTSQDYGIVTSRKQIFSLFSDTLNVMKAQALAGMLVFE